MVISKDTYNQAVDIYDKAQRVLICVNNRSSLDTHLAAAAFYRHCDKQGKSVSICVNGELILKHKQIFENNGIEYSREIGPSNYVITIDHTEGGIERVSYDDKEGKFRLYITPTEGAEPFDFDKVNFSQGGGDVDAIFTFGVRSLQWLGGLYDENKEMFENLPVVNINNLPGTQEYGKVKIVDTDVSVSEAVYNVIKKSLSSGAEQVSSLLLMGVLDHLELFQNSDYKISTVEAVSGLVRTGGDLKKAVNSLYFGRTFGNFELTRRVMNNVKIDSEAGVAWSSVSSFDLSQAGVNRDSFILDGRIIFNICEDFKLTFVMYEVQDGEIVVEFESNDRSLDVRDVLSEYKVSGNEARAFFTVRDKTLAEVEQSILEMVANKVGVSPVPSSDTGYEDVPPTEPVDMEDRVLTPSDETEDNGGPADVEHDLGVSSSDDGLVTPPPISPDATR